ncbi:MAG: PaaI family thioesterase [Sumerlaeia bacterium]
MRDRFFEFLGAEFLIVEPGHVEQRLIMRPELLQRLGVLHGGIVAALVDDTLGRAANGYLDLEREVALTSHLDITYLGSAREGIITVEGRVPRAGRTVLYGEATVSLRADEDAEPKVIARGSAILIRTQRRYEGGVSENKADGNP